MEQTFTLDELAELSLGNLICLWDTSAIIFSEHGEEENEHIQREFDEKRAYHEKRLKEFRAFNQKIEQGVAFYITQEVHRQLEKSKPYHKPKNEKGTPGRKSNILPNRGNKQLGDRLKRLRRKERKERNRMPGLFMFNDRILRFTPDEQRVYEKLYEEYSHLRHEKLKDAGFDFLISGATICSSETPVWLVSSSYLPLYTWNDMLRKEKSFKESLVFVVREDYDKFRKAYTS